MSKAGFGTARNSKSGIIIIPIREFFNKLY